MINVGGKLLKVLFETATTDQIETVEKRLTIQSQEINDLHHFTVAVSKTFKAYQSTLNLTLEELEKLDNRIQDLTMAEEALNLCLAYDRMISDAKHNELNLEIFNISRISDEIFKFQEKFGYNLIVPIHPLEKFKNTVRTSVIDQNILITIFFEDPEEITRHIKISPFPMMSNFSNSHKFHLVIENQDILISNKSMGIVDSSYMNSCINIDVAIKLCQPYLKFPRERTSEICEYNLVTKSDISKCQYKETLITAIQLIESPSETILSGVPGDVISLSCRHKKVTYFTLPSSGLGIFAPTCSLNSKLFAYDVMEKKQVNLEYFTPIPVNKNLTHNKYIQEIIEQIAEEKLPSLEHFSIPDGHSIVSFWGTCFSILLILSFFVAFCVCRGRLKARLYGLLPTSEAPSSAGVELQERPPSTPLQVVNEGTEGPERPPPLISPRVVLEV